jgi:hypothetical protein
MEGRGADEVTGHCVRVNTDQYGSAIVLYGKAGGQVWTLRKR